MTTTCNSPLATTSPATAPTGYGSGSGYAASSASGTGTGTGDPPLPPVYPPPEPPQPPSGIDAVDDTITDNASAGVTDGNALTNDTRGNATLSVASQPQFGSVTVGSDGRIAYEANQPFGTDSFTYTLSDSVTGESDTATITVNSSTTTMGNVTANDDTATLNGASVLIDVLTNDILPNPAAYIVISNPPVNGTAVVQGLMVSYTPFSGSQSSDSFSYIVYDNEGHSDEVSVTVTYNVTTQQNRAPDITKWTSPRFVGAGNGEYPIL